MIQLMFVVLAHLLYDFHWQGDFVARMKGERFFILFIHTLTWTLCICAVLWFFNALALWKFIVLLVSHTITDKWKSRLPKTPEWWWAIYVDQSIHAVSLLVVAL